MNAKMVERCWQMARDPKTMVVYVYGSKLAIPEVSRMEQPTAESRTVSLETGEKGRGHVVVRISLLPPELSSPFRRHA
jgi:hypothetical protein